jgi:hypothetical protein
MSDQWRLAFMIDAPGADLGALEAALRGQAGTLQKIAGEAHVRLGVSDRHPDLSKAVETEFDYSRWRDVDGAVEVTVAAARAPELPELTRRLAEAIHGLAAPGSAEVMTGPIFEMVPRRDGATFLSLAFKRDPAITSTQFRDWWRFQHAVVAIPVLGAPLLAYDQVHVDPAATEAVSKALGVTAYGYDAYDNLTFADRYGYMASTSDVEGMARVFADEIGHIDDNTRRHALMRLVV